MHKGSQWRSTTVGATVTNTQGKWKSTTAGAMVRNTQGNSLKVEHRWCNCRKYIRDPLRIPNSCTYSGRSLLRSLVYVWPLHLQWSTLTKFPCVFLTIPPTVVPYVLLTVGPAVVDFYWVLILYLSHLHLQQSISCGFPHVFLTVAPTVVDL